MRKLVGLVLAFLLIGSAAAVAAASIPDANGVIHGCRKNSGGALRIIDTDAGQTCASNETALNWNQSGLSGYVEQESTSTVPANTNVDGQWFNVMCPSGKRALGGGGHALSNFDSKLLRSIPVAFGPGDEWNGWGVQFDADGATQATSYSVVVRATCVNV